MQPVFRRTITILLLAMSGILFVIPNSGKSPAVKPSSPSVFFLTSGGLEARFDAAGAAVRPDVPDPSWRWHCRLARWGRPGRMTEIPPTPPVADASGIRYLHDGLAERWERHPGGIEHLVEIPAPPPGEGPLVLEMASSGLAARADGADLLLASTARRSGRAAAARYGGLRVIDAHGTTLAARLEADGERIAIVIPDEGAYPILVDPLVAAVAGALDPADQAGAGYGSVLAARSIPPAAPVVAVGAPDFDREAADEGAVFIHATTAGGLAAAPTQVLDPADQAGARYGTAVALGDFNGDGRLDLAVGAPGFDAEAVDEGRVFIHLGTPAGFAAAPDFTLDPADQAGARFGASLAAANLNFDPSVILFDRADDLVVGAPGFDANAVDEGRVYEYFGDDFGVPFAAPPTFRNPADQAGARFGETLIAVDVHNDGFIDVVAGAPFFDAGLTTLSPDDDFLNAGRVYLFKGSDSGALSSPVQTHDAAKQAGAHFGLALAAGDFNGDGFNDLAVGSPDEDAEAVDEGVVRIIAGGPSGLGGTPFAVMHPSDQAGARFGAALSFGNSHGDGDGFADLAAGAPGFDGEAVNEGRVYVLPGNAAGAVLAPVLAADPADATEARVGAAVLHFELTGDPDVDLIAGAPGFGAAPAGEGRVFVFLSSRPPGPPAGLAQLFTDGVTPIPAGGFTEETSVRLRASVNDANAIDTVKLQVEVRPLSSPFSGVPTAESLLFPSGTTVTILHPVPDSDFYGWRARAVDSRDVASPWVSFQGDDAATDFIRTSIPLVPAALVQFQSNGTIVIPVGGTTTSPVIQMQAVVDDPDAPDTVRLQVELLPVGVPFAGIPTFESPLSARGATVRIIHPEIPAGRYRWQSRARDDKGAVSSWVSFGGNPETEPDVILELGSEGRSGSSPCFAAAAGAWMRPALFAAVALAALGWMRRRFGAEKRNRGGSGIVPRPPQTFRGFMSLTGALACLSAPSPVRAQAPIDPRDPFQVPPPSMPPPPLIEPEPLGVPPGLLDDPLVDPIATGRNNVWHTIVGLPPFEAARTTSVGGWEVRSGLDVDDARLDRFDEGGDNRFDGAVVEGMLQVDHGVAEGHQLGARILFGEVVGRDERIFLWDEGRAATAPGNRRGGPGGVALRHKWAPMWGDGAHAGILTELKLPAGDPDDLLTGRTTDLAMTGLAGVPVAGCAVHASAGMVLPMGDTEAFLHDDRLRPIPTAGLALAVPVLPDRLAVLAQAEWNRSAFKELGALRDPVGVASGGLRLRISGTASLALALGRGFSGPLSTELHRSLRLELRF